jgi:hypothetical protein
MTEKETRGQDPEVLAEVRCPPVCCIPSKQRLAQLEMSRAASTNRLRAVAGSLENMVRLEGEFRMGSETLDSFPLRVQAAAAAAPEAADAGRIHIGCRFQYVSERQHHSSGPNRKWRNQM